MTNKLVAIQGNHPSKLNPKSDTSIFLAIEAQNRKYKIFYYEPKNLSIINDKILAKGEDTLEKIESESIGTSNNRRGMRIHQHDVTTELIR